MDHHLLLRRMGTPVADRNQAACPLRPGWLDEMYRRTGYKRILLEEKTEHGATIRRVKIVPLSQAGDSCDTQT